MAKAKKPPTIDEQLREAIENSGQTRYAIAKAAGVAQPIVDRFVSGERDLRLATAAKLAQALGLTLTKTEPR